jgi:hypothetical protein
VIAFHKELAAVAACRSDPTVSAQRYGSSPADEPTWEGS